jgi:hypothetical protein
MLHLDTLYLKFLMKFDGTVRHQMQDHKSIPVIIINFNQLFYLKQLVDFLIRREFKNIIIIDNAFYLPTALRLLIQNVVTVEKLNTNFGHDVFFKNRDLQKKYGKGFYFLTDSDIVPNKNLPKDFETVMLNYLFKYYKKVNKIGFAIDTKDIPDYYPLKEKSSNLGKTFLAGRT